jgi:hypothetical protein
VQTRSVVADRTNMSKAPIHIIHTQDSQQTPTPSRRRQWLDFHHLDLDSLVLITQIKLWMLVTFTTNTAPILTLGAPIHILTAPLLTLSALTAIRGCWDHFQNWQDSKMHTKLHTRVCLEMSSGGISGSRTGTCRRGNKVKQQHQPQE